MPLHLNISASQLTGDYYERKEKKSNILITQPEVTTKKAGGVRVLCASFFFFSPHANFLRKNTVNRTLNISSIPLTPRQEITSLSQYSEMWLNAMTWLENLKSS